MRKKRRDRIDRDLLHVWLWDNRGRNGILGPEFRGAGLARQFGWSRHTPVRLFGELVEEGKLRKTKQGYQVVDPAMFYE